VIVSHQAHAFEFLNPRIREGLVVGSRRNFLKAGLAGVGGLTLPDLLRQQAMGATGKAQGKSVILLWLAGGPSHIDTLDPKPGRPVENRGPFGVTRTRLPGVQVCEHLPKLAAMLDKFTVVRSLDAHGSNHEPNTVFQTGNVLAEARTNPQAVHYPAIGSHVAKLRGANHPLVPAYATFMRSRSHLAFGGYLGRAYDPFQAQTACRLPVYDMVGKDSGKLSAPALFQLPANISHERLADRRGLSERFNALRSHLERAEAPMAGLEQHTRQALELLTGRRMQQALDLEQEPAATRERYGSHLWSQQVLLARRMVEAGVSFVTLDLSYHTASGTWDTHGDNIPPYGGIEKGLKPLLPVLDHLVTTLVEDLRQRGLLDQTLVIAMGEFGRTPKIGTQDSSDGRDHWPIVASMLMAGGGLRHGQVIGSTEPDGGQIATRPVHAADLAATIYQHFGVPLDAEYLDGTGRPVPIVYNGSPIHELF
jgi:hypothetical protein